MAQQNIILKRSSLPGKVPDISSLNIGEIAVNTYDGKLFIKRSGSIDSIESVVTTNSITTGSITLTNSASFGELVVSQDANIKRDLYVNGDMVGNGDLDVVGNITGSNIRISETGSFGYLKVNDTLTVNHGVTIISGSLGITSDLTVLGSVNAKQFNIAIISSSVLFESGSSKFGNSLDDTHIFTGSVNITGSFLINGTAVGVSAGPNTFDFNLDPEAAGTVNFIEDGTGNTQAITRTGSFDILIDNNTHISISPSTFNVTTGSITTNYYHLAKYITIDGDLDFN